MIVACSEGYEVDLFPLSCPTSAAGTGRDDADPLEVRVVLRWARGPRPCCALRVQVGHVKDPGHRARASPDPYVSDDRSSYLASESVALLVGDAYQVRTHVRPRGRISTMIGRRAVCRPGRSFPGFVFGTYLT